MSAASREAESAQRNPSVSRGRRFVSGASLRWWDRATPKQTLQALLHRRFQLVCNGWVPVDTKPQSDFAGEVSAPDRCPAGLGTQCPWKKVRRSPIELLFRGRVDMSKVCDWFMQTTETRSLAIGKRVRFRKQPRGKGFGATRRRGRRVKVRPAALVQTSGTSVSGSRAGRRDSAWSQAGGSNNWLACRLVGRRDEQCRREPPPDTDPSPQEDTPAAALSWETWSPPVLSVPGTRIRLVPHGNDLPVSETMQEAGAPRECPRPPGPPLLGCLRECWVLLTNIEGTKSWTRGHPCSSGKVAKVGQGRRKRAACKTVGYTQPGTAHRVPGSASPDLPRRTQPLSDLPSKPGARTTAPVPRVPAKRNQGQQASPLPMQPDNLLSDVQWQLVGFKECRVILRKIKVLDGTPRNGRQSSTMSPQCKHTTQSLEGMGESAAEIDQHPGANSQVKPPSQRLATTNPGGAASAFAKRQCFGSTRELNTPESAVQREAKETFTDAKWKQGLRECKVVLEKITPLVGNRFSTLADGQLFRLGWNAL